MPHIIVKLWPGKSERQKTRKVYQRDIVTQAGKLYKKPGYTM